MDDFRHLVILLIISWGVVLIMGFVSLWRKERQAKIRKNNAKESSDLSSDHS